MSGKAWLTFFVFLIIAFIGLVVYDNQESIHWSILNKYLRNQPDMLFHLPLYSITMKRESLTI